MRARESVLLLDMEWPAWLALPDPEGAAVWPLLFVPLGLAAVSAEPAAITGAASNANAHAETSNLAFSICRTPFLRSMRPANPGARVSAYARGQQKSLV